ncbi:hypothetical protein [Streptomyces phaeochromogenes]
MADELDARVSRKVTQFLELQRGWILDSVKSDTTESSEASEASENSESSEATETSETSETTEGDSEASEYSESTETSEASENSEDSEGSEDSENSENTEDNEGILSSRDSRVRPADHILSLDLQPDEWGPFVTTLEKLPHETLFGPQPK